MMYVSCILIKLGKIPNPKPKNKTMNTSGIKTGSSSALGSHDP